MSIKIYNGYKITYISLYGLREFCLKTKEKMDKIAHVFIMENTASISSALLDDLIIMGEEQFNIKYYELLDIPNPTNIREWSPLRISERILQRLMSEASLSDFKDEYDIRCSACFIPIEGKTLALLYTQHKEYEKLWRESDEVECYEYWNNTDKPCDVSYDEWKTRKQDWDSALLGIGIPKENGLIYEFVQGVPILFYKNISEVLDYMPSKSDRANMAAFSTLMENRVGSYETSLEQFTQWVNGEGLVEYNNLVKEYMEKLIDIDAKVLNKSLERILKPIKDK
jgi:hypothetical protein